MDFLKLVLILSMFFWGCKNEVEFSSVEDDKFEWTFQTRKINCLLIDLRNANLFNKGHFDHAVNIPYSNNFVEELDAHLSKYKQNGAPMLFVYDENKEETITVIEGLRKQFEKKASKYKIKYVKYKQNGYSE